MYMEYKKMLLYNSFFYKRILETYVWRKGKNMNQIMYKVIYNSRVNKLLRGVNKSLKFVLSEKIKIPPSGILKIKNGRGDILKIKTNQTKLFD